MSLTITVNYDSGRREFAAAQVPSALQTAPTQTELPRALPLRSKRVTKIAAAT